MPRAIDTDKRDALEALARAAAREQYQALIAQANAREALSLYMEALEEVRAVAEGRANG